MERNSINDLLKELESTHSLLEIKALSEYRRSGVVVAIEKADTGCVFDRTLILSDGSRVTAWI